MFQQFDDELPCSNKLADPNDPADAFRFALPEDDAVNVPLAPALVTSVLVSVTAPVLVLNDETPDAAGVAHTPSPRQNVVLLALEPLLRWLTPKLPVTSVPDKS